MTDLINALFTTLGALFILNHCRVLYQAKTLRGVSILSTAFFAGWGIWNLYYYPALGQWLSFAGGIAIVAANVLLVGMMIHYKEKA